MAIKLDRSKFSNNLASGYKLVPLIDLATKPFEWTPKRFENKKGDDAFHPSSHCTPSTYDLYDMIVNGGPEEKLNPGLCRTFAIGHFLHQYLQHLIVEELGFATWADIERPGERVWGRDKKGKPLPYHWVRGSADIAPCKIPGQGEFLIDIKSCNSYDFKTPGLPKWAKEKYTLQIQCYLELFDMDYAIILKVQKESPHDMAEVLITRDQRLISRLFEKWEYTSECLDLGHPPTKDIQIFQDQ